MQAHPAEQLTAQLCLCCVQCLQGKGIPVEAVRQLVEQSETVISCRGIIWDQEVRSAVIEKSVDNLRAQDSQKPLWNIFFTLQSNSHLMCCHNMAVAVLFQTQIVLSVCCF